MSKNVAPSFKDIEEGENCAPVQRSDKRRNGVFLASSSKAYLELMEKMKDASNPTLNSINAVPSENDVVEEN